MAVMAQGFQNPPGLEIDAMAKAPVMVALFKAVQTDNEAVLVYKGGWYGNT